MKDYFKNIFQYENWANLKITDCLLSTKELPEKPLSLISHIANAQMIWLGRIKNEHPNTKVWQIYDRSEISGLIKNSSSNLIEFINSISENDFKKLISYTNTKGDKFNSTIEEILIQLTHHSAYHRGQIVLLLKNLIPDLPVTDYIYYLRSIMNK